MVKIPLTIRTIGYYCGKLLLSVVFIHPQGIGTSPPLVRTSEPTRSSLSAYCTFTSIDNWPFFFLKKHQQFLLLQMEFTLTNLPPNSEVSLHIRVLNKYYAGSPSSPPLLFRTSESRKLQNKTISNRIAGCKLKFHLRHLNEFYQQTPTNTRHHRGTYLRKDPIMTYMICDVTAFTFEFILDMDTSRKIFKS